MRRIDFIKDCATPPEHLPKFVECFQALLEARNRDVDAAFYTHAGLDVLHARPPVDTKAATDRRDMVEIADAVTDLAVKPDGSVSGKHGDGCARTRWNRELYDDALWGVPRNLKVAFDPDRLFNPGNVYGDHDMTEHLRYNGEYSYDTGFEPSLDQGNENGMQGVVRLRHGCGGYRRGQDTSRDVTRSTYRTAGEEIATTRGRANLLR